VLPSEASTPQNNQAEEHEYTLLTRVLSEINFSYIPHALLTMRRTNAQPSPSKRLPSAKESAEISFHE